MKGVLARHGIDVLIPIGGEGTLTAAHLLSQAGVPVVGIPKTIDNDIDETDLTFGFDTAVSIATEMIDRLHTTAESHQRVLLVEVMGRHAGWIALHAGLASGAHITLVPEEPFDIDEVCRLVSARFERGDSHVIGVVAEGATPLPGTMPLRDGGLDEFGHRRFTGVAQQLGDELERRTGKEVRTTVLGHVQRGGTPTSFDRVLATRFGLHATVAAHEGAARADGGAARHRDRARPARQGGRPPQDGERLPAGGDRRLHRLTCGGARSPCRPRERPKLAGSAAEMRRLGPVTPVTPASGERSARHWPRVATEDASGDRRGLAYPPMGGHPSADLRRRARSCSSSTASSR